MKLQQGIQVDFSCLESPAVNRMLYQPRHTAKKAALERRAQVRALKALQYMAVCVPVVLSPVRANSEVIAAAGNGLWARDPDDWYPVLRRASKDGARRDRVRAAGRLTTLPWWAQDDPQRPPRIP